MVTDHLNQRPLCYFNAQSVRNKLLHINDHLSDKNFGIIGIAETWLMEKDHAIKKQLTPTGYILKCIDRKGRSGWGGGGGGGGGG